MKITIISDVHIGNYPNYETYKYERLEWYVDFAQLIVEHSKENGSKILFIAGDFMDQPVNSPEILRIAKRVVEIFTEYFDQIYYVLGQHDLRSKNYNRKDLDKYSITNVLASSKMIYADHQIFNIGGRNIAFMNFNPEPDLEWIKDKVDVFIGHVTINTNGFGSEIDHTKFTLGIAGDIHYPCNEDNLYSVGIGVPRYLGDYKDGTYIILDTDDLSWSRNLVDPNEEYFTRYIKTHNPDAEGPSEEKLKNGVSPKVYRIYRPTNESLIDEAVLKEFSDDKVRDINDIISVTIKENGFEDIHQKVLSLNQTTESVDLDFKLQKLYICNIRSIDEHVVDFTDKEGVLQIAGDNGCFTGDTRIFTPDGDNPTMKELYESGVTNFPVFTYTDQGIKIVSAEKCVLTKRVNKLCKVTLDDGTVYKCTPDHLFLTADRGYVRADKLIINESLHPIHTKIGLLFGKDEYLQVYDFQPGYGGFIHQLLGEFIHPDYLNEGLVVHHKDCNAFNNHLDNLSVITWSEHTKIHRDINTQTGVKTGYYSETVSKLNEQGSIIFGKISKFFRVLLGENEITDYQIDESLYEELRSKYIELGYIHYKTPHFTSIEEWNFSLDDLWNDADYERQGSYSEITEYKNPERISNNLADLNNSRANLANYNSEYHPRLRKDVNFETVVAKAKELQSYSPVDLAKAFDCSRSKINSVIYYDFNSLEEFAKYVGLPYYNHKVTSVEIIEEGADVYDLVNTGPDHNFAICASDNSGVFVHNSGKSSVIWSLMYALTGNGNINEEIREGCDFASVYLEVLYQGKVFGIYRGTDGVSLDIDGETQSLGGKRATENGIYELLPFIYYMDSFFFMDDSVSILSSYSVDRRIELLSTYYRIDVLQSYYQSATQLRDEIYQKSCDVWQVYADAKDNYDRRKSDLLELKSRLGDSPLESLEESINELKVEYEESVRIENELKNSNKKELEKSISDLKSSISSDKSSIAQLRNALKSWNLTLSQNEGGTEYSDSDREKESKELELLKEKHSKKVEEYNKIQDILGSTNKVECPNCHTEFDIHLNSAVNTEELGRESEILEEEISEIASDYKALKKSINDRIISDKKFTAYNTAKLKIESLESSIKLVEKNLSDNEEKLNNDLAKLQLFDTPSRSSTTILSDIQTLSKKISKIEDYNKREKELKDYENSNDLENKLKDYQNLEAECNRYNLYISAFATNGVIYKLVLKSILNRFNSDRFKYEVVPSVYRGTEYNDVIGYYKDYKMKNWRVYYKLSRGQRTLVDLDFIRNLVTNSGIIVFDEILKYLTNANQIEGLRIINSMNPRLKIVTNQNENSVYVDHCLSLTYNGEVTEFEES